MAIDWKRWTICLMECDGLAPTFCTCRILLSTLMNPKVLLSSWSMIRPDMDLLLKWFPQSSLCISAITLIADLGFVLFVNFFTFSKTRLAAVQFPLTWFTINADSLKTEMTSTFNFLANSSLTINVSYSASLFEDLNPTWKECSIHSLLEFFSRIHAHDPFSFDESSTYKLHTSVGVCCSCSCCSEIANSAIKSAKISDFIVVLSTYWMSYPPRSAA